MSTSPVTSGSENDSQVTPDENHSQLTIRALTIRQPWASLMALRLKQMETRSWDTKYRGPVAIHAGLAWPCPIGNYFTIGDFEFERCRSGLIMWGPGCERATLLPMGAVVAVGELFQTRSTTNSEHCPDDRERALGDHSPGRFAWSITSISRLPQPIPAVGHQGFWSWEMPAGLNEQLLYPIRTDGAS